MMKESLLASRSGTIHVDFPSDIDVCGRASSAVLQLCGFTEAEHAETATAVLCHDYSTCEKHLRAGRRVLHAGVGPQEAAYRNLQSGFPETYEFVQFLNLQSPDHWSKKMLKPQALSPSDAPQPEGTQEKALPDALPQSRMRGKVIWVVDDTEINRRSAVAQYGSRNTIVPFSSYIDAMRALGDSTRTLPDVLLLDLLMPVEDYAIGGSRFDQEFRGRSFSAGAFLALLALRKNIPTISIQTDCNHHHDPAAAALDFVGWGEGFWTGRSTLQFQAAHLIDGVKDWVTPLEGKA
jgi:CheY-like chemotaxis protein